MFQAQDGRIWSRIDLSKGLPPFEFWDIPTMNTTMQFSAWFWPPCLLWPKKVLPTEAHEQIRRNRKSVTSQVNPPITAIYTYTFRLTAPMSRMSSPWSISGWDNLVEVDLEGVMNGWSPMNRVKKLIQGQQGFRMFLPSDPQGLRSRLLGCVSLSVVSFITLRMICICVLYGICLWCL
jgi:hypothetical protein